MAFSVSIESQINRKNVWNIYYAIYLNDYTQEKMAPVTLTIVNLKPLQSKRRTCLQLLETEYYITIDPSNSIRRAETNLLNFQWIRLNFFSWTVSLCTQCWEWFHNYHINANYVVWSFCFVLTKEFIHLDYDWFGLTIEIIPSKFLLIETDPTSPKDNRGKLHTTRLMRKGSHF